MINVGTYKWVCQRYPSLGRRTYKFAFNVPSQALCSIASIPLPTQGTHLWGFFQVPTYGAIHRYPFMGTISLIHASECPKGSRTVVKVPVYGVVWVQILTFRGQHPKHGYLLAQFSFKFPLETCLYGEICPSFRRLQRECLLTVSIYVPSGS